MDLAIVCNLCNCDLLHDGGMQHMSAS